MFSARRFGRFGISNKIVKGCHKLQEDIKIVNRVALSKFHLISESITYLTPIQTQSIQSEFKLQIQIKKLNLLK